jgi:hypothetical protein
MIIFNKFSGYALDGRRTYNFGGGGGSPPPAPTNQTVTQTNIPEYLRPYAETMMGTTQQQLFNYQTNADGTMSPTSIKGFIPYGAQIAQDATGAPQYDVNGNPVFANRPSDWAQAAVAGFSPMQMQSQQGTANLQMPGQYGTATNAANLAANQAANNQYNYGAANYLQANAPQLSQYQMQGPADVRGSNARAAGLGATPMAQAAQFQGPGQTGYQSINAAQVNAPQLNNLSMQAAGDVSGPSLQNYQMGNAQQVTAQQNNAPTMATAQTGYNPALQNYQMGPASQVGTQDYTGQNVQNYMSPYMQNVVNTQMQEANRNYDISRSQSDAQATQRGAFGGGRNAIMQAENARNRNTALNQIQATGAQNAFQNAQAQFNQQQQANLQAQQANQQAGLTTGQQNLGANLQTQQLGTQTGLQTALANLSSQQQANVQNQAAQLQTQGLNAQQAMQAALANQQAGLTTGQQNLAANLQTQGLGANLGQQASLANQANQQQANLQNLSAGLQTQGLGAQTGLTAQQLNQQAGMQAQQANQQAGINTGQFNAQMGYNTGLQNAQMQQQANLANQQMMGQYGITGAGYQQQANLQNAQLRQQANLANQQMGYNVGNTNLQALLGTQQLGSGQNMQAQQANQQGYQNAQQLNANQQQFGANYGLQNIQQLLASSGILGTLGGQQLGAQQSILQSQAAAGAQQQAMQQNIINQAIQNYATQQQYPQQQLAFMNAQLRGLPTAQTTTQSYQAAPSNVSQIAGLGTAALGAAKLAGAAKGGSVNEIKKMSTGGIASGVPPEKLNVMLGGLTDQQLAQKANPQGNDPQTAMLAKGQQDFRTQMRPGVTNAPTQFQNLAGGGIVAFAAGDVVKDDSSGFDLKSLLMKEYQTPAEEQIAKQKALSPDQSFVGKYRDLLSGLGVNSEAENKSQMGMRLLQAGLGMAGGTSPYALANINQGAQPALAGFAEDMAQRKKQQFEVAKQQFELDKFGYSTDADIIKSYQADKKDTLAKLTTIYGNEQDAKARIKAAEIGAAATRDAAGRAEGKTATTAKLYYDAMLNGKPESNYTAAELAQFKAQARNSALQDEKAYSGPAMANAITNAEKESPELEALRTQLSIASLSNNTQKVEEITRKIQEERNRIVDRAKANAVKPGLGGAPAPVVTPTSKLNGNIVQNKDGTFNYVPNAK